MPSVTSKCKAFLLAHLSSPTKPASLLPSAHKRLSSTHHAPAYSCAGSTSPSASKPRVDPQRYSCVAPSAEACTSSSSLHSALLINASPSLTHDVDQLLQMCLHSSHDLHKQASTLHSLCSLCSTAPSAADICVGMGGLPIVLAMLKSTAPGHHHQAQVASVRSLYVEKTERALRLLELITNHYSEAGCAAAFQHTTSIIEVLSKKLLRVSDTCTASAIAVLLTLCCRSEAALLFRKAVAETAIPSKLVVVLQVAVEGSTKQKAGRLLRLLAAGPQISA